VAKHWHVCAPLLAEGGGFASFQAVVAGEIMFVALLTNQGIIAVTLTVTAGVNTVEL
jgi:hypothetical protein